VDHGPFVVQKIDAIGLALASGAQELVARLAKASFE